MATSCVEHQAITTTGSTSLTILVDSGASKHYFDSGFYPGLQRRMLDYAALEQPHQIIASERYRVGHGHWHSERHERRQNSLFPSRQSRCLIWDATCFRLLSRPARAW